MKTLRYCFLFFALCLTAVPSHAQWAVFDSTNYAKAMQEYAKLVQMYQTGLRTYNLAQAMSQMPHNYGQRYNAPFALWTTLRGPSSYGNTSGWMTALNTGDPEQSTYAYSNAVVQPNPYPSSAFGQLDFATQSTIQNQYATSNLAQGITTAALTTVGQIRAHSQALNQQISNLEADSYSDDPSQQSEMAVLGKVNAANVMQVHAQQDTNQLLAAGIQQQMMAEKQVIDTQNRAINQQIAFQQNFSPTMQKINNGVSESIQSVSFSTTGH